MTSHWRTSYQSTFSSPQSRSLAALRASLGRSSDSPFSALAAPAPPNERRPASNSTSSNAKSRFLPAINNRSSTANPVPADPVPDSTAEGESSAAADSLANSAPLPSYVMHPIINKPAYKRFHRVKTGVNPRKFVKGPGDGTFASLYKAYGPAWDPMTWEEEKPLRRAELESFLAAAEKSGVAESSAPAPSPPQKKKKKSSANFKNSHRAIYGNQLKWTAQQQQKEAEKQRKRAVVKARNAVLSYLSNPDCRLFSEAEHIVAVSDEDLDEFVRLGHLIRHNQSYDTIPKRLKDGVTEDDAQFIVEHLVRFDELNKRFQSYNELVAAVKKANSIANATATANGSKSPKAKSDDGSASAADADDKYEDSFDQSAEEEKEKERKAKEEKEKESAAAAQKEKERKEREEKEKKDREERERKEKERVEKEKAEKAEKDRVEKERAEKEKVERERKAKEEAEKKAKEDAEKKAREEREKKEREEKERKEREEKEKKEKEEKEKLAANNAAAQAPVSPASPSSKSTSAAAAGSSQSKPVDSPKAASVAAESSLPPVDNEFGDDYNVDL